MARVGGAFCFRVPTARGDQAQIYELIGATGPAAGAATGLRDIRWVHTNASDEIDLEGWSTRSSVPTQQTAWAWMRRYSVAELSAALESTLEAAAHQIHEDLTTCTGNVGEAPVEPHGPTAASGFAGIMDAWLWSAAALPFDAAAVSVPASIIASMTCLRQVPQSRAA